MQPKHFPQAQTNKRILETDTDMFKCQNRVEQTLARARITRDCICSSRMYNAQLLDTVSSTEEMIVKSKQMIYRSDEAIQDFATLRRLRR